MTRRIQFEAVWQRYRVIRERPDSLREAFTKVFRARSSVHEFVALRNACFEIRDGEVVGFVGRNGSGKSTILKIMCGVFEPTDGRVTVNGTMAALIELGAGFHADLTGRENILLNGLLLGLTKKEIRAREESIIAFSELDEFIDSPVKQYSSGMFMRLAFSIAVEVDPDILLVDEILSVGDAEFREKCNARISEFRANGKTIVLVSHDPTVLRRLCTRLILIDHGQILGDGPVTQVLRQYSDLTQHPAAVPAAR